MKTPAYQSPSVQNAAGERIKQIFASIKGREIAPWDSERLILEAEVLKGVATGRLDDYIAKAEGRLEKNNFDINPSFKHTVAAELELMKAIRQGPEALGALAERDNAYAIHLAHAVSTVAGSLLGLVSGLSPDPSQK